MPESWWDVACLAAPGLLAGSWEESLETCSKSSAAFWYLSTRRSDSPAHTEQVVTGFFLTPFFLFLWMGCSSGPAPLPTQEAVSQLDIADQATPPPIYQLLYDSAFLPEVRLAEQRTRILIWLRYLDLKELQLRQLLRLHERAMVLKQRVERSQAEIMASFEPKLVPTYDAIFDALRSGTPLDDPSFTAMAVPLLQERLQDNRLQELLSLRLQSVRALLDEEQEFLRLLTSHQEALFPDVLFVLRHSLDMAATPGDFKALVGTTFSAGDPTLLLLGDYDEDRGSFDLGGLWSEQSEEDISAPILHEARRELLLYLLLQEPALPQAIEAAIQAVDANSPPKPASSTIPAKMPRPSPR